MIEIIPGILEQEWAAIEKKIELVRPFAKTIHVDLLDGKFASNITFADPTPFAKYTSDITFELHMMVEDPLSHVEKWAKAGFRRFIGHVEKMPDQEEFVSKVQQFAQVGLALDGTTPLEALQVPLEDLDTILCMTIRAGFSGQTFQRDTLPRVKKLTSRFFAPIEVDGGINDTTIAQAYENGATRFVTTSYLFGNQNPRVAYLKLHHCLGEEKAE